MLAGKGQTRFTGFDDKIISIYARGMSTREIQGHLEEIYKVEVSPNAWVTYAGGLGLTLPITSNCSASDAVSAAVVPQARDFLDGELQRTSDCAARRGQLCGG